MKHEDFISDNLVNISDRLKQNYRNMEAVKAGEVISDATPMPPVPPASEKSRLLDETARAEVMQSELFRQWQFELAAAEKELNQLEQQTKNWQEFRQVTQKELQLLGERSERPATGAELLARLERLQLEHETQRGRAMGMPTQQVANTTPTEVPRRRKKFEEIMYESIPLFLALGLAALIVSGALALIFM